MDREIIYGNCPSKSNSYKIIKINNAYTLGKTHELRAYEKQFLLQCRKYKNANIDTEFEFYMDVYYPSMRTDLDNSAKCVLDCLQKANAIKNDNRCMKLVLRKFIDKKNPRIEFVILKKVD